MAALSFCQSLVQRPLLHLHVPSKPNNSLHLSIRCSSSSPFNDKTSVTLKTENHNNNNNSHPLVCRYGRAGQESKNYVEAFAVGRNIRMSADKARRVIDQIRGRPYEETLMILELMPYRACEDIIRIVFSAAANASHNFGLNKSTLIISGAQVDVGPTLKRIRFLNKGRIGRIKKRTCQITIRVKGLANESEVVANPV